MRLAIPGVVKLIAEHLQLATAALRGRSWYRERAVILAYHNVVPDSFGRVGDVPVHAGLSEFCWQLDAIQRHCDVVSLDEVFEPGTSDRLRVAITIDDAYNGALTLGWNELRQRGMSATCFVAPGFIDGGSFWWDEFAEPRAGLDPARRNHFLTQMHGAGDEIRSWAAREGLPRRDPPTECTVASEATLRSAVSEGLRLGSHSWGHPALTTLNDDRLTLELARPRQWLQERFGASAGEWLAYPYGIWDARVAKAARSAGYAGALRASGGLIRPPLAKVFEAPRVSIPRGLSHAGLRLRLLGLRE